MDNGPSGIYVEVVGSGCGDQLWGSRGFQWILYLHVACPSGANGLLDIS